MKYCKELTQKCCEWVREHGLILYGGARLRDFTDHFHLTRETFRVWMKRPAFREAIRQAQEDFGAHLENKIVYSLAVAAQGYEFSQTTLETTPGLDGVDVVKKKTVKNIRVEPSVAAGIFLLTNIAPSRWRNRHNIDATTNGKDLSREPITIEIIDRRDQIKDVKLDDNSDD